MIALNAMLSKCPTIQAKIKWTNTTETREKSMAYYEKL